MNSELSDFRIKRPWEHSVFIKKLVTFSMKGGFEVFFFPMKLMFLFVPRHLHQPINPMYFIHNGLSLNGKINAVEEEMNH